MTDSTALDVGGTRPGRYGASGPGASLAEVELGLCWNVQGDASRTAFATEAARCFGVSLPTQPNTTTHGPAWMALWMGPTSWLLAARQTDADVAPADAFITTRDALNAQSGALFDVSAARSGFVVRGPHAPEVLGKLCPIDLDVSAFPAGACAQTLLGHVNAMIYRPDAESGFAVLVARSLWRDAWQSLCIAAAPVGYDVVPSVGFAGLGAPLSR